MTFEGLTLWIATVEEVLLAKLEWASKGHSRRQIDDCAQLLRVRGAELDRDYLSRWIAILGVDSQWQTALHASEQG